MTTRSPQRESSPAGPRVPVKPKLPASFGLAVSPDHDLENEATFREIGFEDFDLSGQEADSVEFERCRFARTTLAGALIDHGVFTDCLVENSDWANAKMTKSRVRRARFDAVRLTGTAWIDGVLRDVSFRGCRMDLGAFRFSSLRDVAFVDCNLTRADFTNADLRGCHFVDCDLSGAQFSQAECEGARFERCELAGVGTVTSLRGATLSAHDLGSLAYTFAAALGISIEDS